MQKETLAESVTAVVSRAIAVYDFALSVQKNGCRLVTVDDDNNIVEEVKLV